MAANNSADTGSTGERVNSERLKLFHERLISTIDNYNECVEEDTVNKMLSIRNDCCCLLKNVSQLPDLEEDTLRQNLQRTADEVLEFTYLDECALVDTEFPADTSAKRIADIQDLFDSVLTIAEEIFKNQSLASTLTEDILECIHWRKGALYYMYVNSCHTSERQITDTAHYKQCIEDGVSELEKMLSLRQPVAVENDIDPDDTLQLFSHGVFSDTHLLAMMYAGELCFIHQQAADKGLFAPDKDDTAIFNAKQQGLQHLEAYLKAVNGPLKGCMWKMEKAEKFISYLQQDS